MVRVVCVYEDRRFEFIATPWLSRIAVTSEVEIDVQQRFTGGCRLESLYEIIDEFRHQADVIVIGADCQGNIHAKEASLANPEHLRGTRAVLALPYPSVEGWLLADPRALRIGLSAHSSRLNPRLPAELPGYPSEEREAKHQLGTLVRHLLGHRIPTELVFAPDVIAATCIRRIRPESRLPSFISDFERAIEGVGGR